MKIGVIGGGIVGAATSLWLQKLFPDATVIIFEKDSSLANQQTGHNSNIIHEGPNYAPGSLKAELVKSGIIQLKKFAEEEGIPYRICGKLVVQSSTEETPNFDKLKDWGIGCGIHVSEISPEEAREIEPEVICQRALFVKDEGTIDYKVVTEKMISRFNKQGGELKVNSKVLGFKRDSKSEIVVETSSGESKVNYVVSCAGLQSSIMARMLGVKPPGEIISFRGEYFHVSSEIEHKFRSLVYPVPDPKFPFLGVHSTRDINDHVHFGPTAVLALALEGYSRWAVDPAYLTKTFSYPGFWKFIRPHLKMGATEFARSFYKPLFVQAAQRLFPFIESKHLIPAPELNGVRAQLVDKNGIPISDFAFAHGERCSIVLNAPSPAATASLAIGEKIANEVRLRV
jgi:L-2-hydroxyglutarate oxidase